jgi:seryl-tRNA(Sec) selenium transferase
MGVYEDLGLTPIINASGSVTRLGGAPMPREVLDAMTEAAAGSYRWNSSTQKHASISPLRPASKLR